LGRNVEVMVSFAGLHEKHAVQRGVLGTNSAFALGPRKPTKNLDQVDQLGRTTRLLSVDTKTDRTENETICDTQTANYFIIRLLMSSKRQPRPVHRKVWPDMT
jgi:hypothetical protein